MLHRLGLGAVIATALLMLPAATLAARPAHNVLVSGSFTDTDFCGTGQTVEVRTKAVLKLHHRFHRGRPWSVERTVISNPANDARVVFKSIGPLMLERVVADDGSYSVSSSFLGDRSRIRTGKGPHHDFRSRDPGYVMFDSNFSAANEYLGTDVSGNPLDPSASRGAARLCRVAIPALGLAYTT